MGTAHNRAMPGEIAKTVLMPGDPLRAKFVAENFLKEARLINDVRNMYGFTGEYEGVPVTVMASGMGMPSIGIYSYELYKEYGVENIIRIGSAGAYSPRLRLYDVVLAESAWSKSTFAKAQNGCEADEMYPHAELNAVIREAAEEKNIPTIPVKVHSSDVFYAEKTVEGFREIYKKHGCECVEMESFALFHNANVLGKKAACILTISDLLTTGEETTPAERQNAFTNMMQVALATAVKLSRQ